MDIQDDSILCVHNLFAAQAKRTPNAIALTDGCVHYTYAELDAVTNQLARYLQSKGVGPETIVGCWLHESFAVVVYVLAVVKAGGAYLLLDPHLPSERLRFMIENAGPSFILADQDPVEVLYLRPVFLTQDAEFEANAFPSSPPINLVKPHNLAYIAYTSGSTGRPKGVLITQASTVNHALAFSKLFQLAPGDRTPIMASLAFDMATEEMIPPLISGCTLIDSRSSTNVTESDMDSFTTSCVAQGYTLLNIPAPLWHQWTAYLRDSGTRIPPELRLVIVGSDKVYVSTLKEWKSLPGSSAVQWVAAYGVTEATVSSTFYHTAAQDDLDDEFLVPIGKPMDNIEIYLLSDAGEPVDDGEVGEIYIGGAGIARGYHLLSEKTKAAFLPDTFSPRPDARMYRTGDLARRRQDGNIVWLGRKDSQIKINGLRIELAEIEAVIHEYPGVSEAVVTFLPPANPKLQGTLTAHIQTKNGRGLDEDLLRIFLKSRLHPHMLPHNFSYINDLPLSLNGKVDRRFVQSIAAAG